MTSATPEILRVVVFREGDWWLAQCLERDIGVQGGHLADLLLRLTLALEEESAMPDFTALPAAPEYFQDLWPARAVTLEPVEDSGLRALARVQVQLGMVA